MHHRLVRGSVLSKVSGAECLGLAPNHNERDDDGPTHIDIRNGGQPGLMGATIWDPKFRVIVGTNGMLRSTL